MKHLPNLLKQESSSAATLVHILLRMYYDPRQEHQTARPQVAERLLPYVTPPLFLVLSPLTDFLCACSLGLGVLQDYTKLKADTQSKNIAAWTPVVAEILHGFCKFDDKAVCPPTRTILLESTTADFFDDDSSLDTFPQFTPSRPSC